MQQAGTPDGFPNLFVSVLFVVFNFEGIVGEQAFNPFVMGNIKQDFSVVYSSGSSRFGLFVICRNFAKSCPWVISVFSPDISR